MLQLIESIFSPDQYMPHGMCYLWEPGLVWLHVISNALIAASYASIPVLLVYFVSKRPDIPFNGVFLLFGAFIIACGSGHLMDIWTLWHPAYWLAGALRAVTAIVSVYTAIQLVVLMPQALKLPSPAQLQATNQELEAALQNLHHTQTQLVQTEKMSSLGQMIAGIAHEINNPVNFIYGNLDYVGQYIKDILKTIDLYQEHYPEPEPEIQEYVDEVDLDFLVDDLTKIVASLKLGAERIHAIVRSLRTFSRLDESEYKAVNIHEGIDSTLLILGNRLKAKSHRQEIRVVRNYGDLPLVECYPGALNQVFMNLIANAIDALEEHEAILRQTHQPLPAPQVTITTVAIAGQVTITIQDNGSGIPESVQAHMFNPFFTTKPMGKGTGLGLSISHQIVTEQHQGTMDCVSGAEGTAFIITIPLTQPQFAPSCPRPIAVAT